MISHGIYPVVKISQGNRDFSPNCG